MVTTETCLDIFDPDRWGLPADAVASTNAPDVSFTVARAVQIEAELLAALAGQAHLRGVSLETLVNLWLQQKLSVA